MNSFSDYAFITDAGATIHICKNRVLFTTLSTSSPLGLTLADGRTIIASGTGSIGLHHNVAYCPDIHISLLYM